MQTEISIRSGSFPSYPQEKNNINPARFGKRLAEYIKSELENNEVLVTDIYPTDNAYELRIDQFKFKIYIVIGNLDGKNDKFLISIEPKKEHVRKLFRKISTVETIEKIYSHICQSFEKNDEIEIID